MSLSKIAKIAFIINIILSILIGVITMRNVVRYNNTQEIIEEYMESNNVNRENAILELEESGIELHLGGEFYAFFGSMISIVSLLFLILTMKIKSYFFGLVTAILCLLTSFIGGLLLFYIIYQNKLIVKGKDIEVVPKDSWSKFIHDKSK